MLRNLSFLEMVPILIALYLWGQGLQNQKITLYIDNEALVSVLNKQTSKSKRSMQLVRPFVLSCMKSNILFRARHVYSKVNVIADSISCQRGGGLREEDITTKDPSQFLLFFLEQQCFIWLPYASTRGAAEDTPKHFVVIKPLEGLRRTGKVKCRVYQLQLIS